MPCQTNGNDEQWKQGRWWKLWEIWTTNPWMHAQIDTTLYSVAVIRHKEWHILKQQGKSFFKTPDVQISCLPYLFLLASSNLLCSVDWKWRMIGLVSVRPQTTLSKLRSPQVCHLFIDDGYGGLTRNPKTTVWRNDFEGFWAVSSSPFRSTKPSWAFWPGL